MTLEVAYRLGSGDGEGRILNTLQKAFEPLPASILFDFGLSVKFIRSGVHHFGFDSVAGFGTRSFRSSFRF